MSLYEVAPPLGMSSRIGRSVSLDDAAMLLGVSRRTIYNRIRTGRLRTIRTLGGSQRVLLESVFPGDVQRVGGELAATDRSAFPHNVRR